MSKDNLQIQVRVFDYGKQGVLDPADKISLTFRDEFGQLAGTTRAMTLDEFRKNSLAAFQRAFRGDLPYMTSTSPLLASQLKRFQPPPIPRPLSDEAFSTLLAIQSITGSSVELNSLPSAPNAEPLSKGIQVSVAWHSKATGNYGLDLENYFGVQRDKAEETRHRQESAQKSDLAYRYPFNVNDPESQVEVRFHEDGGSTLDIVTTIDNDDEPKNGRIYRKDGYSSDPSGKFASRGGPEFMTAEVTP